MIRVFPILSLLFFVGCSTPQHSWQNSQRNTVWTAMVAAANAPDYESEDPRKRWIVLENLVDVDASTSKILVHRLLGRSLQPHDKTNKWTTESGFLQFAFNQTTLQQQPLTRCNPHSFQHVCLTKQTVILRQWMVCCRVHLSKV